MAADEGSPQQAGGARPETDTKRKFREALERKNARAAGGEQHKDAGGKQPRTHGPAEQRREFRRKSG
jgi:Family of unknown function (DUF5302)